jgi:hypothetical protein
MEANNTARSYLSTASKSEHEARYFLSALKV